VKLNLGMRVVMKWKLIGPTVHLIMIK